MLLADYLSVRDIKRAAFARKLGTSKGYLSDILNGKRRASLDLALKVQVETKGEVTPWDLDAPWRANNPIAGGEGGEGDGGGGVSLAPVEAI